MSPKTEKPLQECVAFLVAFIAVASIVDGIFTLEFVSRGLAREVNPIMAPLLAHPWLFLSVKLTATLGAIGAIVYVARREPAKVSWVVYGASAMYLLLILWHVYITTTAVAPPIVQQPDVGYTYP
jgi:hypothetical protein